MRPFMHIATLLAAYMLLATQAFGSDWSTILPPDSTQTKQKEVPRREMTIKVGEVIKIPLSGNRSYSCPVEVDGDSVRIVAHDIIENLTLQAAKPGLSTVRIFRKFWRAPDIRESYEPVQDFAITVSGKSSRNGIEAPHIDTENIPLPREKSALDWEGFISRQSEELLTVITDNKEWTALWNRAFDKAAPQVDFEKYAIACVFLGFHADWLYNIHIDEPGTEGNMLIIPYDLSEIILELSGPFRASGQYRMKAFQKKKGYGMILEKTKNSII